MAGMTKIILTWNQWGPLQEAKSQWVIVLLMNQFLWWMASQSDSIHIYDKSWLTLAAKSSTSRVHLWCALKAAPKVPQTIKLERRSCWAPATKRCHGEVWINMILLAFLSCLNYACVSLSFMKTFKYPEYSSHNLCDQKPQRGVHGAVFKVLNGPPNLFES